MISQHTRLSTGRHLVGVVSGALVLAVLAVVAPASPALAVGPAVSSISPTSGTTGTVVTISGSGLDAGCVVGEGGTQRPGVTFAGIAATVSAASSTSVTATAPSQPVGTIADVRVTDCNGLQSAVVVAARFTYVRPIVSAVSPSSGSAGTFVTVSGSNLDGGCAAGVPPTVRFGSTAATVVSSSSTSVLTRAPAGVHPGAFDVVVTDCAGGNSVTSNADRFTYTGPLVSAVSPSEGKPSTEVTIDGEGFLSGCASGDHPVVRFGTATANSAAGAFSPTSIVIGAPPHAAGGVHVTVTDCQGDTSPTSSADVFTYTPTPTLQSVAPASGVIGTDITITGERFTVGCSGSATPTVTVGGVTVAPTGVGATSLHVRAPAHAAGAASVTVTDCDGDTSPNSSQSTFTYLAPEVTRLTPTSGDPGTEVKVEGSSFTSGCTTGLPVALIGDQEVPLTDGVGPSDVALRFTVPAIAGGVYDVRIRNCQGDVSDVVAADRFTVTSPPGPKVTRVAPAKGYIGTEVTIKGRGFLGGCGDASSGWPIIYVGDSVILGGLFNPAVVSLSDTEAVIKAPPNPAGTYDVRVSNCVGDRSPVVNADHYRYLPPKVTKVTPSKGYVGTELTIFGTGFLGGCGTVQSGIPIISVGERWIFAASVDSRFVSISDTEVVIKAPGNAAGKYDVRVRNCQGDISAVAGPARFTYLAPKVTKVTPTKGYVGTELTIWGTGFLGGCGTPSSGIPIISVGASGIFATPLEPRFVSMSDTEVVIKAPHNAAGKYDVRVRNCQGDISATTGKAKFTYVPPRVTKVAPAKGYVGTKVTITGTGFLGGCVDASSGWPVVSVGGSVILGGLLNPAVVSLSDTEAVIKAPPNAAGRYDVRVANCAGDTSAAVVADRFTYLRPTVTTVAPAKGYVGTELTINGTGFIGGCVDASSGWPVISVGDSVIIGGLLNPAVVSLSDTKVVVKAPLNRAGTYAVRVTNCAGDTSAVTARSKFTYLAPKVTDVAPARGGEGTEVTIRGTGFLGGCVDASSGWPVISVGDAVIIGGILNPAVVSLSETRIVILAPPNAAGVYDVRVTDCAGDTSAVGAADRFTYVGS